MEQKTRCFYQEVDIGFHECDKNRRARVETILRYSASIAGMHYNDRGFNNESLLSENFAFLLSRASLQIERMPCVEEHITIETWERRTKGVLFYRDMNFYDTNGVKIVSCSTVWILVNPQTHKILKPSAFFDRVLPNEELIVDCPQAKRLNEDVNAEVIGNRKIVYSDIDGNGHVYNAVYAGIACDFLEEKLNERELKYFQINFKKEAKIGEEMLIKSAISDNYAKVSGEVLGETSFMCEFEYKPFI